MFTGIITDIGTLIDINGGLYKIRCHYDSKTISLGASIACDGCCLTVTNLETIKTINDNKEEDGCIFWVDVSNETLSVTTLNSWQKAQKINLERALKMGDEFGGHIVSGHVDGIASIIDMKTDGNSTRFHIKTPDDLKQFIAPKGSVTLNGVSLTVNEVEDQIFTVNIIPHTMSETVWQFAKIGTELNIEVDLLARYALRAMEVRELMKKNG